MEELLKELEEAKAKIAEIEKKIEEKKAKTGRWKPEEGDKYWHLNGHGIPLCSICDDNIQDVKRYAISNCFKTKEECEFAKEKLKVIAELKDFAEPKNRAWNGNFHYFIYYNYTIDELMVGANQFTREGVLYFESKEKAQQAINAIGEDRIKKYYLGVEE